MTQICLMRFSRKLLLLSLLVALPATAPAQSAWQWQMSLRVETAGDAMYMPSAVSFDPGSERYYVIDTGRQRLVSFDRQGALLRVFTADDRLRSPFDMVRLDGGQLWVVEKGGNSLTHIDIGARVVTPHILWDGERQVFPDRVAGEKGQLYVLDRASGQVLRLDDDLAVERRYGCDECQGGFADFVLEGESLWALESMGRQVFRFHRDGSIAQTFSLGDEVIFPVSLALDPYGLLYILDRVRGSVAVYGQDGRFRYRFLKSGQGPGRVYFPRQVRFDPWGNLCVVDEGNGSVEIYGR